MIVVGKTYEYIKNDNILFFKVIKIENNKAFVEGVTKNYWITIKALEKRIKPSMMRRHIGLD